MNMGWESFCDLKEIGEVRDLNQERTVDCHWLRRSKPPKQETRVAI